MKLSLVAHGAITFYFIGSAFAFSPASVVPRVTKIAVSEGLDSSDIPDSMPNTETKEGRFEKFIPSDEEEKNQGGTRFQQMMQAAQAAKSDVTRFNPSNQKTSADTFPPPQSVASETMESLSVDQQAAMFRAMMQQQQQPLQTMSASPREGGIDSKGRKIGRNRDADTIANTADVYFAQLKRDSSVRTMARIRGDDETADRVFEDEGVKQLKDQIKRNPHLER